MKLFVCAIVVVIVAGIAGCGGGGGSQPALVETLSPDIVGTYRVQGLNLPDNEIGVKSNGDVVVYPETTATRSNTQAKIGSCSAQGAVSLNGSWTMGGTDYTISASGNIVPASRCLTMLATVTGGNLVMGQDTMFSGDKIDDMLKPPPPPEY